MKNEIYLLDWAESEKIKSVFIYIYIQLMLKTNSTIFSKEHKKKMYMIIDKE